MSMLSQKNSGQHEIELTFISVF